MTAMTDNDHLHLGTSPTIRSRKEEERKGEEKDEAQAPKGGLPRQKKYRQT